MQSPDNVKLRCSALLQVTFAPTSKADIADWKPLTDAYLLRAAILQLITDAIDLPPGHSELARSL